MDKKTIDRLELRLCKELDEIADKDEMSLGDLQVVDMSTHSLKSLEAIKGMTGQSQRGGAWNANGTYNGNSMAGYDPNMPQRRTSYADGMDMQPMSYADGMSYRGRDRMGRYSAEEGPEVMRDVLQRTMDSGTLNPRQRKAAHELMDELNK